MAMLLAAGVALLILGFILIFAESEEGGVLVGLSMLCFGLYVSLLDPSAEESVQYETLTDVLYDLECEEGSYYAKSGGLVTFTLRDFENNTKPISMYEENVKIQYGEIAEARAVVSNMNLDENGNYISTSQSTLESITLIIPNGIDNVNVFTVYDTWYTVPAKETEAASSENNNNGYETSVLNSSATELEVEYSADEENTTTAEISIIEETIVSVVKFILKTFVIMVAILIGGLILLVIISFIIELANMSDNSGNQYNNENNEHEENFPKTIITMSDLNIREGPGFEYDVRGSIEKGTKIKVYGENNGWYEIYEIGSGFFIYVPNAQYGPNTEEKELTINSEVKEIVVLNNDTDVIKNGKALLNQMDSYSILLLSSEIKLKISRTKTLLEKIFEQAENSSDTSLKNVKRIVNIYMPEILKLLKAYENAELQPFEGDSMRNTKKDIENFFDVFNESLEQVLNDMFQEILWNVSSSISALTTALEQSGMKQDSSEF